MSRDITAIACEYIDFEIEGKRVGMPYSMVLQPNDVYDATRVTRTKHGVYYSGKGSPEQIRSAVNHAAKSHSFDLKNADADTIYQFMFEHGMGIDCSGFVYNVLDKYLQDTKGVRLSSQIVVFPGLRGLIEKLLYSHKRVMRCSAQTLTSTLNTVEIKQVRDVVPGDMIRFTLPTWTGKHIAIITETSRTHITYAHSGEGSEHTGPHQAVIKIIDPTAGLDAQQWSEKLHDGSSYKTHAFHPDKGDSVRRLKCLAS